MAVDCGSHRLRQLNGFVGANGSKSNLIEATTLRPPRTWCRSFEMVVESAIGSGKVRKNQLDCDRSKRFAELLRHSISFTQTSQRFEIVDDSHREDPFDPYFFYKFQNNQP